MFYSISFSLLAIGYVGKFSSPKPIFPCFKILIVSEFQRSASSPSLCQPFYLAFKLCTIIIMFAQLIALQKPGKPKGPPKNLRPITLLNTIRKALSIITFHRIRPCTEEYLSHSQSGFRPDRSTADVAWAHKWLAAKTKKEDVEIKIQGCKCFLFFRISYFFNACAHSPFLKFKM